jgi:hypothetical protein
MPWIVIALGILLIALGLFLIIWPWLKRPSE